MSEKLKLTLPAPIGVQPAALVPETGQVAATTCEPTRHGTRMARLVMREQAVGQWAQARGPAWLLAYEFVRFGVKQAWACLFAALMLALILGTWLWYPKGAALARYDVLTLAAVAIQLLMLATKLETWEEARVIAAFHCVGTVMEVFKTAVGSWTYPEDCLLRIAGVPLFTGFMYACVGSFMVRCWHLFAFRFERHPPLWALVLLSVAIYLNFFTHHYIWDLRLALFAVSAALLGPATIHYRVWQQHRRMPLLLAAMLAAIFLWVAENIGTLSATWVYPDQRSGWRPVSLGKHGSWYLLMIISYTMVFGLRQRHLRGHEKQ
jgi:uncharacterized membrane protein YoaT (DUF817 family)